MNESLERLREAIESGKGTPLAAAIAVEAYDQLLIELSIYKEQLRHAHEVSADISANLEVKLAAEREKVRKLIKLLQKADMLLQKADILNDELGHLMRLPYDNKISAIMREIRKGVEAAMAQTGEQQEELPAEHQEQAQ